MPYIYTNVFISQHYTPASTLYQGKSRAYYLYILMSSRPPSVIRQPVYHIRRHLGHAVYICQYLYILALYASQYTISSDIQAIPYIYTNIFAPSQRYTPASIAYQEISRKCHLYIPKYISSQHYMLASILYQGTSSIRRLYIPMSLYPSIIYQPIYYTRGRPVYTAYIYQSLYPSIMPIYPPGIIHQLPDYTQGYLGYTAYKC